MTAHEDLVQWAAREARDLADLLEGRRPPRRVTYAEGRAPARRNAKIQTDEADVDAEGA